MNLLYKTIRFFTPFCFLFGFVLGQAQTDARCYDAANAGTVGEADWTGCAGMYIVVDRDDLVSGINNGFTITHDGVDYTFGDSAYNIFTGQVTTMYNLFLFVEEFNEDIGYWDISNVTDMNLMFMDADSFNQDISSWDTSKVTSMIRVFRFNEAFNQDISSWDTSNVTNMRQIFDGAVLFNQNLRRWNVANVSDDISAFDQDATAWTNADWRPIWGTAGDSTAPVIQSTLSGGTVTLNTSNNAEWITQFNEEMVLPTVAEFLATKALRVGSATNIVTADSGELLSIRYGETDGSQDRAKLVFEIEVEPGHASYQIRVQYGDTGHDNSGLTDLAGHVFAGSNASNGYVNTSTLSTADLALQALVLYPNPVTNRLHIESPLAEAMSYTVYDLTGKALSTQHKTGQSHSIDVSALAKGVYLLEATHNNNTTAMQFVKE